MLKGFWSNKALIKTLVKRDVVGRYQNSMLGILWSFFNPLFMLAVYTFIFSEVFKARWAGGSDSKAEFALLLFAGLIVFNLFAECFNRAPSTILANANYVKKVIFPLDILAWVNLGAALFHALICILVWLLFYMVAFGIPHLTVFLFPFVLLPLLFFIVGVSWFFSALGTFLRDIVQLTAVLTTAIMFMSPILYPIEAIPERYRYILQWNPLSVSVGEMRSILYWGMVPDLKEYMIYFIFCILVSWLGFTFFQKSRKGFADVL